MPLRFWSTVCDGGSAGVSRSNPVEDRLSRFLAAIRGEIARKHGTSKNTYFNWKSRYGGATVSDLKWLKELEAENAKLKRLYGELALENAANKDLLQQER